MAGSVEATVASRDGSEPAPHISAESSQPWHNLVVVQQRGIYTRPSTKVNNAPEHWAKCSDWKDFF